MSPDPRSERYLRHVVATVLTWYLEFEDGIVGGTFFHPDLLNYRIDVERLLDRLSESEQDLLFAVHRDGLSDVDAAAKTGWRTDAPDRLVAATEIKLGRLLVGKDMLDLAAYLSRSA